MLEATLEIRKRLPRVKIIVLSQYGEPEYVRRFLKAGVSGYVLKRAAGAELVAAIRAAAKGDRYLSPPLSQSALASFRRNGRMSADPFDSLTARELDVLRLTAEGLSGAQVAERLLISPRTVETHRSNISRKLNVKNQKELIRYAIQRKLVTGVVPDQPE